MMLALMLSLVQAVGVQAYLDPTTAFDAERGLLLERMALPSGAVIEYERPVVILPPTMTAGELHTSQRRFVLRESEGGDKRDVGAHYFEAELLRTEELEGYGACLVVRRRQVRMDFSGSKETVDVTEWYAKGRGRVKAVGERVETSPDGAVLAREPVTSPPPPPPSPSPSPSR